MRLGWRPEGVLLVALVLSAPAAGQEIEFFVDEAMEEAPGEAARLSGALTTALVEMASVCDLELAQLQKLRVAIKGAVESHQQNPNETTVKEQDRLDHVGVGFGTGGARPEPKAKNRRQVVTMHGGPQPSLAQITHNVVWVKAVRSVLTDAQLREYQKALAERASFRRKALALRLVAAIDQSLMLSPEQREQFQAVLERRLVVRDNANVSYLTQMFGGATVGVDSELPSAMMLVSLKEAEKVLNEHQRKLWKTLRKESLNRRFGGFGLEQEEDFEIELTGDGRVVIYAVPATEDASIVEELIEKTGPESGDR